MTEEITTNVDQAICTITISNRKKRNALSGAMITEINNTLEQLKKRDDIYVIVFTGVGEMAFSSGFDISEFSNENPMEGENKVKKMLRLIEETDYPTVAKINGDAVGAGFELVAACDLRIATEEARLGITPAKIGIVLSGRAVKQIVAAVGPTNAKELLFTAKLVDANRAKEMGLLNQVVKQPKLDERTNEIVEQIAVNAPLSLRGIKSIIHSILDKNSLTPAEKEWVNNLQEEAFKSRDHEEGRLAFQENRSPEFEGY
jgi:methylmalonyl-CoA decarboxylase